MKDIVICVCTKNRKKGIVRLLSSIDKMIIPEGVNLSIVIVENDEKNYSEDVIKKFSTNSNLKINYYLEQKQGISFARNKAVKEAGSCEFCCFVDDDQEVHENWLKELLSCQNEFNADGVTGPNPPLFDRKVPEYVSYFHEPNIFEYGVQVERAATNCLLIKKSFLDKIDGPFDSRLNFSGGEDMLLTSKITKLGGVIRYNPNAIAYEIVPESRLTLKFIFKRTIRIENCYFMYNTLRYGKNFKYKKTPKLILRFFNGIILLLPYLIFGKKKKLTGLLKIVNAYSGLMFLFGTRNNYYKTSD